MRTFSRKLLGFILLPLALAASLAIAPLAWGDDDDDAPARNAKGHYEVCQHQKDGMDCYRIFEDCSRRWQVRDAEGASAPCNLLSYAECRNLLSIVKNRAETLKKMGDDQRDVDPGFRLACRGYTLFTPNHFYVTCPSEHKHGYKVMHELGELLRTKCR